MDEKQILNDPTGMIDAEKLQQALTGQTKQDSSLNKEEAQVKPEPPQNDNNQNTDTNVEQKSEEPKKSEENSTNVEEKKEVDDFDTRYQERFNKEVSESYVPKSEYETKLSELQKSLDEAKNSKPKFHNELTDKLAQLDAKGIKITKENLNVLLEDYSNADFTNKDTAMDLVRQEAKLDGYPDSMANKLLKVDYPALFDEDATEEEIEAAQLKLTRAAKSAKEKLLGVQSDLQQPSLVSSGSEEEVIQKYQQNLQQQQEQTNQLYRQTAERLTQGDINYSYDVDGVEYKVDVSDLKSEIQAEIEAIKFNPQSYMNFDANGNPVSFNEQKMVNDAIRRVAFDKILAESIKQAKSNGSEDTEKDLKNTNFNNQTQTKDENQPQSHEEKVFAEVSKFFQR